MKNKTIKGLLIISAILIVTIYSVMKEKQVTAVSYSTDLKKISDTVDFSKYDSLMIVAHPDDETIWGGNHLLQGNYVVVCITNGDNKVRSKEFYQVMQQSNSAGIILSYPDKTANKRDNWESSKESIKKDIQFIMKQNEWKHIVTHNPNGEYGHQHHIMTNHIVTNIAKQEHFSDKLQYFGKYIKKEKMSAYADKDELKHILSASELNKKEKLTSLYVSQHKVMQNLKHMFPYENWISYQSWYNK